jgi:regulator of protease activity HflC (stomatin/prohibitin superfamily)
MNIILMGFALVWFSFCVYMGLSSKSVKRNQVAAVYVRGKKKPVMVVRGPRFLFIPLGYKEIKIATTKPQTQVRPDPTKLQMDSNAPLEKGKMYPLEISHNPFELAKFFHDPPTEEEKNDGPKLKYDEIQDEKRRKAIEMDLFQQSNTSRVRYVIRIKINPDNQESIYYYFKNTGSFKKAWEICTEAGDSILEELLSPLTMREATDKKLILSSIFQSRLQKVVQEGAKATPLTSDPKSQDKGEPPGFEIDKAFIEDISPDPAVRAAQDEAMAAQSRANSKQQEVEAEARNIQTMADADLYVKVKSAEGDSEALKKRGAALSNDGASMIFAADNVKEVLKGALVVDSDKALNLWLGTGLPNPLQPPPKKETAVKN